MSISTESTQSASPTIIGSPDDFRFASACVASCGVPNSPKANLVSDALSKIMNNGASVGASAAVGFGGVVAAATALLGTGADVTSAFTAAGAGLVASVAGGFNKSSKTR